MSRARPLSLSDPECLDPSVAGAKAARLARAQAAGLPVLPAIVVPAAESVAALADAEGGHASGGVHAARLTVMDADTSRLDELPGAAAALARTLVVRSSSPLEGSSRWSGAFTSFLDVRPEEVLTAVRGVWASAASDDAADRAAHEELDPTAAGLAVLVQPQVEPEFSGTAEVDEAGVVTVVVVAGPPAPLVAGWEPGHLARCAVDGRVSGQAAVTLAGRPLLRDVADLARAVRRELGDDLVEWAAVGGELVLLQTKLRATPVTPATPHSHDPLGRDLAEVRTGEFELLQDHGQGGMAPAGAGELPAGAADVAGRVLAVAGPTGERLVLPWLLAGTHRPGQGVAEQGSIPASSAITGGGPEGGAALAAWDEAVRLAEELTAEAWPFADDPSADAYRTLTALRGGRAADALHTLQGLPNPDQGRAARALALFDVVGRHLVEAGALTRPDQLWALAPDDVHGLLAGDRGGDPARATLERHRAALRWEPLAYTAVMSEGVRVCGVPASPGAGAGRVVFVAGRPRRTPLPPRAVIVAPRPLPHLAPLLWGASALVTFGGNVAAHLVEVARSLAVPAVVGCDAESLLAPAGPALAAVDGDRGRVAAHSARGR